MVLAPAIWVLLPPSVCKAQTTDQQDSAIASAATIVRGQLNGAAMAAFDSGEVSWRRYMVSACNWAREVSQVSNEGRCRLTLSRIHIHDLAILDHAIRDPTSGAPPDSGTSLCLDKATTRQMNECLAALYHLRRHMLIEAQRQIAADESLLLLGTFNVSYRDWESFSESHCRSVGLISGGASSGATDASVCLIDLTTERLAFLRQLPKAAKPRPAADHR